MARQGVPQPIYKAVAAPVIDGVLNEAAWKQAIPVDVCYEHAGQGRRAADRHMTARFAWDEFYLYIGYEVYDTNLVPVADGRIKGPPANRRPAASPYNNKDLDVTEFLISFGDERFLWELQHNAANDFNEAFANVPDTNWPIYRSSRVFLGVIFNEEEYLKDDGSNTFRSAVSLMKDARGRPSTLNDPRDIDTGYTGELRIPWIGLCPPVEAQKAAQAKGLPKEAWDLGGQELRILSAVLDGNIGQTYYHSSATRPATGMFAAAVRHFPRYVLVATPPPVAP